ncbi:YfbU family protein [Solibacillus sp. FSL R7-0668]|uniref:YfbU family protein n=1 Tax=Solibacillus sp. FSL R7-0668 TaxID=2921688 RepID=UPI0030F57DC6
MNDEQRLLLLNQYDILSKLDPEDNYYSKCRDILANGYEVLYSEISNRLSEPMSSEQGGFVIDVLQMYRVLNTSYEQLEDKENITDFDVAFKGFDGNEEGKYYSFAQFFLDDYNRFGELKENESFSYNSHSNRVEKYSRMVMLWKDTADRYNDNLTAEEIKSIINA